jgi:hypothetical protein
MTTYHPIGCLAEMIPEPGTAGPPRLLAEVIVKLGTIVLVVWLLVGVIAAGQRHDFGALPLSCNSIADVTITIAAGALNYLGVDPKVSCHAPVPSK